MRSASRCVISDNFEYSRGRISSGSDVAGGQALHREIGKVISRQVQGVLEQSQDHADLIARAMTLLAETTSALAREYDTKVLQQLDDLQVRIAELQRGLNANARAIGELRSWTPGSPLDIWYDEAAFTAHFRGAADELGNRYKTLAARFKGHEPVLDLGFGAR